MKRIGIVFSLLLLLGFVSVSCKEDNPGHLVDIIYGKYTFSHAEDAFFAQEGDDFHFLCYDAVVTIARDEENESSVNIKCPGAGFSHCFHGPLFENENDFVINMSECDDCKNPPNCWDLMAEINREDGNVRLSGSLVFTSGMDGTSYTCYFDVAKN